MLKRKEQVAFGLYAHELAGIRGVLSRHPAVARARIYGSRAMGTYYEGSDVDLALEGDIPFSELLTLKAELSDLGYLLTYDVLSLETLTNADLRAHIERVAQVLYERE